MGCLRLLNHPFSDGPIRLLIQFNFLSSPDAKMLKHILEEGHLASCRYGQSSHWLSLPVYVRW
jgi:hypothetical protein